MFLYFYSQIYKVKFLYVKVIEGSTKSKNMMIHICSLFLFNSQRHVVVLCPFFSTSITLKHIGHLVTKLAKLFPINFLNTKFTSYLLASGIKASLNKCSYQKLCKLDIYGGLDTCISAYYTKVHYISIQYETSILLILSFIKTS